MKQKCLIKWWIFYIVSNINNASHAREVMRIKYKQLFNFGIFMLFSHFMKLKTGEKFVRNMLRNVLQYCACPANLGDDNVA